VPAGQSRLGKKARETKRFKRIRGLSRGLAVLRAMNGTSQASILALNRSTGISRPALYRILKTLREDGYVAPAQNDHAFRLTSQIRELSVGFRDQDSLTEAAGPILDKLQQQIVWPTDLAVYDNGKMLIRETTRRNSPLVFDRATVGWRLPVLQTSLGIAYLSGLDAAALNGVLRRLKKSNDPLDVLAHEPGLVARYLERARSQAYASRPPGFFPITDSIAVCLRGTVSPIGAIGMTFVASAMSADEAAKRFLVALNEAAHEIALKAKSVDDAT
jgi:IclR family transcriptional regulator, mhp operon transcriptional activator